MTDTQQFEGHTLGVPLKPCPLCDGKQGKDVFIGCLGNSQWRIHCVPCDLSITNDRKDKVIGLWNERSELTRTRKVLEELVEWDRKYPFEQMTDYKKALAADKAIKEIVTNARTLLESGDQVVKSKT